MIILLATAIGLVFWSFLLVRSALRLRDPSLIFASTLVALSAVGMVAIYLLMDGYTGYLSSPPVTASSDFSPPIVVQQNVLLLNASSDLL